MRGRPFRSGYDPRRGRGPKNGAPNAGRPPAVVRHLFREVLQRHGIPSLQAILQDPQASRDRKLRAIDLCAKYGLGSRVDATFDDGDGRVGVVILPAQDEPTPHPRPPGLVAGEARNLKRAGSAGVVRRV